MTGQLLPGDDVGGDGSLCCNVVSEADDDDDDAKIVLILIITMMIMQSWEPEHLDICPSVEAHGDQLFCRQWVPRKDRQLLQLRDTDKKV